MQKFDWSIEAFNQFERKSDSWKVRIEESEDKLSDAVQLLKAVKKIKTPDNISEQIEQIKTELSSTLDKLRTLRTNMKSMV
jgi:hypothetical protein